MYPNASIKRQLELYVFRLQAVFAFAEENYMGVVHID
jgi:hypothetical protein